MGYRLRVKAPRRAPEEKRVRVCPRCQHENPDDTDFCAKCGEYLRWDPTVATPAVPARPPLGRPAARGSALDDAAGRRTAARPLRQRSASVAGAAAVNLRLAGADAAAVADRSTATVEPGRRSPIWRWSATRAGSSTTTTSRVRGPARGLVDGQPPTVYLVPFGAPGGTYEQEVEVRLHPPRTAEAVRPRLRR